MKSPWLSRNPFLSVWLSAANGMLGAARGHALGQARRQQSAMMSEGARTIMAFWGVPPARKRGKRGR